MAIAAVTETLIRINDVPQHVPGRPHISWVYRHMNRPSNPLETVLVGGRRWSSVEAVHRFIQRCNAPDAVAPSKRRRQELEATDRELSALGI